MSDRLGGPPDPAPGEGHALALPGRDEVRERERRFAELRAAWSAMEEYASEEAADRAPRLARELLDDLSRMEDHAESAEAGLHGPQGRDYEAAILRSELDRLDGDLDRYAELLRTCLDPVWPALRATLPRLLETDHRDELTALVDLALEDEAHLDDRVPMICFLTSLLSTEEHEGHRRVARDPAALTPSLRAVSERIGSEKEEDSSEIEQEFVDAAARCDPDAMPELDRAMETRKRELGRRLLAAPILRAVVFYEAAAWNATHATVEAPAPPDGAGPVVEAAPAAVAPVAPQAEAAPVPGAAPDVSRIHWASEGAPPPTRRVPGQANARRSRLRAAARVGGAAAALGLAAYVWVAGPRTTVRVLSRNELRGVSAQLDSGYRDHSGAGPLFIGSVGPRWKGLTSRQREDSAQQIVSSLGAEGVREILLYDKDMRLVVHQAKGLPLRVDR
jgi:hypothetical protein